MDSERSQLLSNLIGSISISELTLVDSNASGEYVIYGGTGDAATGGVAKIAEKSLYAWLMRRIFFFMCNVSSDLSSFDFTPLRDILTNARDPDELTTPITVGRYLWSNYRVWMTSYNQTGFNSGDSFWSGKGDIMITDWLFKSFQYHYFDNLGKQKRTMLIGYGLNEENNPTVLSTTQWDTNLAQGGTINPMPSLTDTSNRTYCLFTPSSALSSSKFRQRNYAAIVTGKLTKPAQDKVLCSLGQSYEPNRWYEGDIDSSIRALSDYVNKVRSYYINKGIGYKGMVIITTRPNELASYEGTWNKDIFSEQFFAASEGGASTSGGEEQVYIADNITHSHNAIKDSNSNVVPTKTVAILGRPEGETVGGIATNGRTVRKKNTNIGGRPPDNLQVLTNTNRLLTVDVGAYSGGVRYTLDDRNAQGVPVTQSQQTPHNNMPLYYRVCVGIRTTEG